MEKSIRTMHIKIRNGLTLSLPGVPEPIIRDAPAVRRAGVIGADYRGVRPSLAVEPGDVVSAGQVLFTDRRHAALRVVAPAAGRIEAISLGPRRALQAIVIDSTAAGARRSATATAARPGRLDTRRVRKALLETGLWPAIRARPFSVVPPPTAEPQALTVSLVDSRPLAPDPAVVVEDRREQLAAGIEALSRLAPRIFVCKPPPLDIGTPDARNLVVVDVEGPHPSGLPGTQIERLAPASADRATWYVGYQDVLAIGGYFLTGRVSHERVVAIGGPGATRPGLVRTRAGAAIDDLVAGSVDPQAALIAGCVLSGRVPGRATAFLGRYETQISALPARPTGPDQAAGAGPEGVPPGMLPSEAFESVWPLNAPPLVLLRALLAGDAETAETLGCLGLDEEDLALCACVCPAGLDYGSALRAVLDDLQGHRA